jgi:hypothetical protein
VEAAGAAGLVKAILERELKKGQEALAVLRGLAGDRRKINHWRSRYRVKINRSVGKHLGERASEAFFRGEYGEAIRWAEKSVGEIRRELAAAAMRERKKKREEEAERRRQQRAAFSSFSSSSGSRSFGSFGGGSSFGGSSGGFSSSIGSSRSSFSSGSGTARSGW